MPPRTFFSGIAMLAAAIGLLACAPASARDCDGRHFAADDQDNRHPLRRPPPEFAVTLEKARAGDSREQRSLAVMYEAGYLVSRCMSEAVHWYRLAAEGGDSIAKQWVERRTGFDRLLAERECAGERCNGVGSSDGNNVAVLYASTARGRHFFAPVTINGKTVEGMIDTGASMVAMSTEAAQAFGIRFSEGRQGMAMTANGRINTYRVTVPQMEVAGIRVHNVPVSVGITGPVLVGMSFLSQLDVSMTSDTLTMRKRQ